jgi:hypothetical protein
MMEIKQQMLDVCNYTYPALSMLNREHVNIKPRSCWCCRVHGTGVVRIATDFKQENARICPAILDEDGIRLDGDGSYERPAMCHGWSGSIILGHGTPTKRYVVFRNEGDQEVSFNVLLSPD